MTRAPPLVLDARAHRQLRVAMEGALSLAAAQHCAPIGLSELEGVCANFPLLFLKDARTGALDALALLGLSEGENLFLDQAGRWNATYLPQDLARYPFALAGEAGELCLLEGQRFLSDTRGERLYGEDGAESGFLREVRGRLGAHLQARGALQQALQGLARERLLAPFALVLRFASGKTHRLEGLYSIDREALRACLPASLAELHAQQSLWLAHAALLSLGQFSRLAQLRNLGAADPIVSLGPARA